MYNNYEDELQIYCIPSHKFGDNLKYFRLKIAQQVPSL